MKTCVLFEGGMPGMGVTFHLCQLAQEVYKLRNDIVVVHDGTEQEPGLFDQLRTLGVLEFDYSQQPLEKLFEQKKAEGYDRFIFHGESFAGLRMMKRYKKRYDIHVMYCTNSYRHGEWYMNIAVKAIRWEFRHTVDSWIFFAQQPREEFCRAANVYDKTFIIPWGVEDFSEIQPAKTYTDVYTKKEQPYATGGGTRYVFYAARFSKRKNHPLLVSLMQKHLRNGDVKLMLAGDGAEKDRIHQMCIDLGIRENVVFMGRVLRKELIGHMKNAFCSIVLSQNETFGHCILEPLQLGVPVLSTPTGVAPTIICDFVNGFTIPLSNKKKWQLMIDEVMEGRVKLHAEYDPLYSWPTTAQRYNSLYELIGHTMTTKK